MPNLPLNVEALLGRVPLFSGLDPAEITRLASGTREINAAKGDILFHKGDACTGFHLVVYGQIKLGFTSPNGNEKVVEILGQGQTFGEAVMFMEKPYVVFAQALTDSLLLHISKQALFDEIDRDKGLARKLLGSLSMRLHQLVVDVESYSLHSGKERVIGYLLRDIPEVPPEGTKNLTITLPTNKGIIASRLNLTQEHFSRILHDLSEHGLIVVEGRRIHIPDLERIRSYEH